MFPKKCSGGNRTVLARQFTLACYVLVKQSGRWFLPWFFLLPQPSVGYQEGRSFGFLHAITFKSQSASFTLFPCMMKIPTDCRLHDELLHEPWSVRKSSYRWNCVWDLIHRGSRPARFSVLKYAPLPYSRSHLIITSKAASQQAGSRCSNRMKNDID